MSPVSDGFRHPHRASDEEAGAVPANRAVATDIRCVTRWTKLSIGVRLQSASTSPG